jgi:hypothetical protein
MAISSCVSKFYLDRAVQLFDVLCRNHVTISHSIYNAVLDACARATILWNSSTPLADLNINALASLSGSGICPFSLTAHQTSFNASAPPFSRANWTEAIRLFGLAVDEGVVSRDLIVPLDKQSKDSATLVLDARVMSLGSCMPSLQPSTFFQTSHDQVWRLLACTGGCSSTTFPRVLLRLASCLSASISRSSATMTAHCLPRHHHHHNFTRIPYAPHVPPSSQSFRSPLQSSHRNSYAAAAAAAAS